jgi:hypothetical protein
VRFSHLHVSVSDLPGALEWLARVWDIQPTFQDGGGMAEVSVHGVLLVIDAADEESPVTIGLATDDCDRDHGLASERGAETLEPPEDRAWGVRAAYVQGPGQITFEIEQSLRGA